MTIKHSISKIQWAIVWALNYYIIELSWVPKQLPGDSQTRCGREGHTRPRGPSESPDGVDPNIRRTWKTQRDGHNSGVKIWSLCSVSSTLSHANLEQPFRTLEIKWEVNMLLKKSSCVFLHASFLLASLSLCRCDAEWWCRWLYNTVWFLSFRVFGLLSSSLLLFPQRFGRCAFRPSSAVCRTPNFKLRPAGHIA